MTILVEPEVGVEKPPDLKSVDLKTRTKASANTAKELEEQGLDLEPTAEDKDVAAKLATSYADNPEKTSKKVTNNKAAALTPASLMLTDGILSEFGKAVVKNSVHIRHMVTNKLILETENPDAKVRIRALELLGKISDVGLFAEKSEVTITHQSTSDLKEKLRKKLEKLMSPEEEVEDAVVIEGESFDADKELGLEEKSDDS
tara:strand:+ start:1926 stop:2531 length:606 start_codon:yes stop_codon:yes gene_type:complete